DSSTLFANGKVRQNLRVFLLSQNFLDYPTNPLRIGKYRVNLSVEQSLRVSLDRRNVSVFDARLIQSIAEEAGHLASIATMTSQRIWNVQYRMTDVFIQRSRQRRRH